MLHEREEGRLETRGEHRQKTKPKWRPLECAEILLARGRWLNSLLLPPLVLFYDVSNLV